MVYVNVQKMICNSPQRTQSPTEGEYFFTTDYTDEHRFSKHHQQHPIILTGFRLLHLLETCLQTGLFRYRKQALLYPAVHGLHNAIANILRTIHVVEIGIVLIRYKMTRQGFQDFKKHGDGTGVVSCIHTRYDEFLVGR